MDKNFDVYGLGNALDDMEFEVSPEFLEKMGIKKGLMTLVDGERQEEILKSLDLKDAKRCCGGSAANTIIAVSQFGGKSSYSFRVGNDESGLFYYNNLLESGVKTNFEREGRPVGTTGKCLVFVTPDADRTMNTFLGISSEFSKTDVDVESIKASKWVYVEGYLVSTEKGKDAAKESKRVAEENGVRVALTFSDPFMVSTFKSGFEEIIGKGIDLLFCNEHEAMAFTGEDNVKEAAEQLKKVTKSMAITLGEKGALLYDYDASKFINVEAPQVKAVDSNGAGDLFAGAFLYGINHGMSFKEAGSLACSAASKLVTQFGARLSNEQPKSLLVDFGNELSQ